MVNSGRAGVLPMSAQRIEADTVIYTIGTTVNPLVRGLVDSGGATLERGRLVTEVDMRLRGQDWAWEHVFRRDLSHFGAARSEPISRAHFGDGDLILKGGGPLEELYSIEAGEAAVVVRASAEAAGAGGTSGPAHAQELFRLGPGALVGEATLAESTEGEVELRAVGPVDVLIMGKHALTRLSGALKPLEAVLERAVDRPKLRIWRHHERAMAGLTGMSASELPHDADPLVYPREQALGTAYGAMIDRGAGCLLVTDAGRLVGVATRTDLLAGLARGADRTTPLGTVMNEQVESLAASASAATAAERMADGGLKHLPLVDDDGAPCGLLRSDDFVRFSLSLPRAGAMADNRP